MEAFHITSSLRELARKQRYFHFGSSLLELKIYQALRRFRGIAYITFGMDCAASSNTAPGYDRRYTSGLSGNLEDMGSEMSISRPEPLRNALYAEGWGEGSCFINAALQSLWASHRISQCLCQVLTRTIEDVTEDARFESELALTYARVIRTDEQSFYPEQLLPRWYTGVQDDANDVVTHIINTSTSIEHLCKGQFASMTYQCSRCSTIEVAERTPEDLTFRLLEVLPCAEVTERPFSTLQEAVDDWFSPDQKPDTFNWQCGECQARGPWENRNGPELPPVLVIGLKQWKYTCMSEETDQQTPDLAVAGDWLPTRRDNDLLLNDTIQYQLYRYTLRSIIYHTGRSPTSGHYVSVCKHASQSGERFYLYDDSVVTDEVTQVFRSKQQLLQGQECLYASMMIYERVEATGMPVPDKQPPRAAEHKHEDCSGQSLLQCFNAGSSLPATSRTIHRNSDITKREELNSSEGHSCKAPYRKPPARSCSVRTSESESSVDDNTVPVFFDVRVREQVFIHTHAYRIEACHVTSEHEVTCHESGYVM